MASPNAPPEDPPPAYWDIASQPQTGAYSPAQPAYPSAQPAYPPTQPSYPTGQQAYPQGGHYPVQPFNTRASVVVTQLSSMTYTGRLGESPAQIHCPYCNAFIVTSTTHEIGTCTWAAACVICFLGCWAGCCLIPFCVDGTKDVVHDCPNCKNRIGAYRR
ncbi:lipopolysaccharide-induced tumor necrosis factor-alpha factor homolog [Haliotis asinina]|uniref:lipopolysaccharide-induced tumor necrosis factor-alpha factor homolog n=1 Tax=Haliotis asinina TaxID=109174 RepID=UPI0035327F1D